MVQKIKKRSLEDRLNGQMGLIPGVLCPNPSDKPYWIPEENPTLLVWNISLTEYCRMIRRGTGLSMDLKHLTDILDEAMIKEDGKGDETIWAFNLIDILGTIYWSTHDASSEEPAAGDNGKDGLPDDLVYHPDPNPPAVKFYSTKHHSHSLREGGDQEALELALFCLLLEPFVKLQEQEI